MDAKDEILRKLARAMHPEQWIAWTNTDQIPGFRDAVSELVAEGKVETRQLDGKTCYRLSRRGMADDAIQP